MKPKEKKRRKKKREKPKNATTRRAKADGQRLPFVVFFVFVLH